MGCSWWASLCVVDDVGGQVEPVSGDRVLRVVALQVGAVGVFHDAAVRVGDVDFPVRVGCGWLGFTAADLRAGGGLAGGPFGHPGLVAGLLVLVVVVQELLGAGQPGPPGGLAVQGLGQPADVGQGAGLARWWRAVQGVVVEIGPPAGGQDLGGDPGQFGLDLVGELGEFGFDAGRFPVGPQRGRAAELGAVDGGQVDLAHPGGQADPQDRDEQGGQGFLVYVPEPGDGGVVGDQAGGDDAVGDVGAAVFLDASRGSFTVAVGVAEQGDHHGRVVGCAAFAVGPVGLEEFGEVQLPDQFDQKIGEVVPGQPVRHIRREEEPLLPVHRMKVVRHRQPFAFRPRRLVGIIPGIGWRCPVAGR